MTGSSGTVNNPLLPVRTEGSVQVNAGAEGRVSVSLEADARAEFLVLQDAPETAMQETEFDIRLAEGSSLQIVFLSLDGAVLRNRLRVSLDGERATCTLAGLTLADGDRRVDFDIELTHAVPACHSDQLFKSLLNGRSVSHFDGLIRVVPDAQKTEAYQANHNLLLSDDARAHTRPQLEIYADDVKCSHGATVGRLNPDELFYLRSRGIPKAEAEVLQQMAFAGEVLEKISDPALQERMRERVESRLRKKN